MSELARQETRNSKQTTTDIQQRLRNHYKQKGKQKIHVKAPKMSRRTRLYRSRKTKI
ncbi:hypothetical protein GCM10008983_05970 [Lentibacillus halophilus]|uniref:Uncharacterized protein n=1 Tax=Lentibacillus halophilus TaxID=295065 RepID=A0ABP3J0J5_9BACI